MYKPNYDFDTDFKIARKTEKQIARFLAEKHGLAFVDECNNSDYDIRMRFPKGREVTIEIKEDFSCARTGNIGVEFESWGRVTGIEISKADYYLYKIHKPDGTIGVYIIKTELLKQMIADKLYHRVVVGGDVGSNSKNYLFKLQVVVENFKFLGIIEAD